VPKKPKTKIIRKPLKTKIEELNDTYPFGFADIFDGLSNPINRAIFRLLEEEPLTYYTVSKELGISQRTAKKHLNQMYRNGMVHNAEVRIIGGHVFNIYGVYKIHKKIIRNMIKELDAWKGGKT